jgi:hypothetical protein
MSQKNNNNKDLNILRTMSSRPSSSSSIKGNSGLLKIFCCLVVIILICIAIGHYAFKNGMLTCDHYILNTYLYVILAIALMMMLILLNDKFGIFNTLLNFFFYENSMPILSAIVMLIIIITLGYAIVAVNPQNIIASNAIWLMLIIMITFILIPTIYFGRMTDIIGIAGLITVGIVIATGLAGYYYGDKIVTFDWDYYLYIALIALVVVLFVGMFIPMSPTVLVNFIYLTSIISLIIFVLLLLSYNKTLKSKADQCVDGKVIPNYPLESWQLVIKIVNIFADVIRILATSKARH